VNFKYREVLCIVLIAAFIILGGLLIGMQMYRHFLPQAASWESVAYDNLFRFTVSIAAMIFLLVQGMLIFIIVRFRRRPDDVGDGPPIHGNTTLEAVWTIIPAVIVTVLAFYSYDVLKIVELPYDRLSSWFCGPLTPAQVLAEPISGGDVVVDVIGYQFYWEFRYPQYGNATSTEMHVPVDEFVLLRLTSNEVIHSFWVPEFRFKKDAPPGYVNQARFRASVVGTYPIICAELCGLGHSQMRARLVVESREDFERWANGLAAQAVETADPMVAGRQLFVKLGCGSCHILSDAGGNGVLGPALDGLSARAGSRIPGLAAEDYVRQSILNPKTFIVEGYLDAMPSYADRVTEMELSVLVQYLLSQ